MKNFEKYKDDILKMASEQCDFAVKEKDGSIVKCRDMACSDCIFGREPSCGAGHNKWLYKEYKKSKQYPKLTRFQYEFLRKISKDEAKYRWLCRNFDNRVIAWVVKPRKENGSDWYETSRIYEILKCFDDFEFIKQEDEEPWDLQELLENCEVEG